MGPLGLMLNSMLIFHGGSLGHGASISGQGTEKLGGNEGRLVIFCLPKTESEYVMKNACHKGNWEAFSLLLLGQGWAKYMMKPIYLDCPLLDHGSKCEKCYQV